MRSKYHIFANIQKRLGEGNTLTYYARILVFGCLYFPFIGPMWAKKCASGASNHNLCVKWWAIVAYNLICKDNAEIPRFIAFVSISNLNVLNLRVWEESTSYYMRGPELDPSTLHIPTHQWLHPVAHWPAVVPENSSALLGVAPIF